MHLDEEAGQMSKKNRSKLKLILSFAIGALLLVGMLWYVGFNSLWVAVGQASVSWLIISALTVLPVYLLRAWRWRTLLKPVKNAVEISNTFWTTSIGFMANTLIPIRLGEIIRVYILGEKEKVGFASGFSSVVIERTLDLLALVTLGLTALLILPQGTGTPAWLIDSLKVIGGLVAAIMAILIVGTKKEKAVLGLLNRVLTSLHIPSRAKEKITEFAKSLIEGAKGISQSPKILVTALASTWALWFMSFTGFYFVFKAFNYPAAVTTILLGAVIMYLTSIIPAAPGYMGTYEAYWTLTFLGLGLTQIDLLLAMGLVSHLIGLMTTIILGCAGIMWLGLSFEEVFKIRRPERPQLSTLETSIKA